ncbi:MAG: apolipoprotein N-acyltransferase [Acidimicrobiia bacterium]
MRLAVALGAGVVAGFCFAPHDLGPLIVLPIAALLGTWRGARVRDATLFTFAFGIGCYSVVVPWIHYFGVLAFVALVVAMSTLLAIAALVVALLATRGMASPLLTAAAWVLAEAIQGRFPFGGFPWADVGLALHDIPAARAVASVGGVLGVSFITVAAAGFLVDLVVALRARTSIRTTVWAASGLAAVLLVAVVARVTWFDPTPTSTLRVAVLQGDDEELSLAGQQAQRLTDDHLELADELVGRYDLIVFPEKALDDDPELDQDLRERITTIAAKHHSDVLVNALVATDRDQPITDEGYNVNMLYEPDGTLQGEYAKQHLVPFGEYVPMRSVFGGIAALRQVPYDLTPGDHNVVFDVKGTPVGSIICFESAFGPLVRSVVRDGAQMIVVSTNNRSYRRSGNTDQHLALGQFRAAETGRPLVQASLSGVSAIVDPDGTVHDRTELFQKAILDTHVTATTGDTLYVRFGDWVLALSCLALLGATVVAVWRPRRPIAR